MPNKLQQLRAELKKKTNKQQAVHAQRFFKTGKGQYGAGDQFIGVRVPVIRRIARSYHDLSRTELHDLLRSRIHEERMAALVIMISQYKRGDSADKRKVYQLYVSSIPSINNWDLVDISAPHIVGDYLRHHDRSMLYRLAVSKNIWKRRIAIISTFAYIREDDFADTFRIAELLVRDEHDLIHKAVGWMLREVGKRDTAAEEKFLKKYYPIMPRTMLRYAIEQFPHGQRKKYLHGTI